MDWEAEIAGMDRAELAELRRLIEAREAELRGEADAPLPGEGKTWLEVGDVVEKPGLNGQREYVWEPSAERYPQEDKRLKVRSYVDPQHPNRIRWEIEVPADYPLYIYQIAGDEQARNRLVFRPGRRRKAPEDVGPGVVTRGP